VEPSRVSLDIRTLEMAPAFGNILKRRRNKIVKNKAGSTDNEYNQRQ